MAEIISQLQLAFSYICEDPRDASLKDLPLTGTPLPTIVLLSSYYYFCSTFGPRFMQTKDAFNLKPVIVLYNVFQIFASAWLFYQGVLYAWPTRTQFFCEPVNYSNDDNALWLAKLTTAYYWLKIVDLIDTVFFVLRKKFTQVTFLHMYHHTMMVVATYLAAKYYPGGHMVFMGQLNAFVHTLMYSYYLMTSINSENGKLIRWKKMITQLQIAQFVLIFIHSFPTLFWESCDYPMYLRALISVQAIFMMCLFGNFYYSAYCKKKSE